MRVHATTSMTTTRVSPFVASTHRHHRTKRNLQMQMHTRLKTLSENFDTTHETTRARGRREVLLTTVTLIGMGVSSLTEPRAHFVAEASTSGEMNPEDEMLREARARVGRAREDVASALSLLEPYLRQEEDDDETMTSTFTEQQRGLPLKELNKLLTTSPAIRALEEDAVVIDALTSKSVPLNDTEKRAWSSVNAEEWLTQSSTTTLPMTRRPNDFLCAVFSCYNDPRAPPSTEMLLTLRLAKDGVKMGLRNDARITAVGLTASLTDVLEKMDDYLAVVDG